MKRATFLFSFILILSLKSFASPRVEAFKLQDNRLITSVYINGKGPFAMMFDTGATNILSAQVAAQLGLAQHDQFTIQGGGQKPVLATYCDVNSWSFAKTDFPAGSFICADLSDMQQAIGFPRLDGLLGYEVFSRYRVKLDMAANQISLSDFSTPQEALPSGSTVHAFQMYGTTPIISGQIGGIPAWYLIDTGDRASLTLSQKFVTANSLQNKYLPQVTTMTGYGIGGSLQTSMAFADDFRIGERSFANPLIRMMEQDSPAFQEPALGGTLGMGLLRQFNLIFDYSRKTMTLMPAKAWAQDRSFDRAGMWLSQRDSNFLVADVVPGGPADQAGIRVQDQIVALNGQKTATLDLLTSKEYLKNKDVVAVQVTVLRNGKQMMAIIKLKDLVSLP
ncbi:aspartyl protease family protein [Bdellovibrio sp. NC01]|uniref:aspartyl protease family protein n=1 Tax=Bdellovibrio sp. NC01 TaxID=2220073 RepID=UPI001157D11E|nr:aspartyl protease family protein [Bdellovibrio sp. NC01]QDK37708.1 hypothetical protein DOE51_08985 [Bdellovibrio sp. NC01]